MYYEDDLYHPNQGNDYDETRVFDEFKNTDSGYHKMFKSVTNRHGLTKRVKIELYSSKINGLIRDALTGLYTDYRVGSLDEDLFFKSSFPGTFPTETAPHMFYYKTPEEYERNQLIEINTETKQRWFEKMQARKFLVKYN